MLSSRTVIGIVVGSVIAGIGAYALITSFGVQEVNFDDTWQPGESMTYRFYSPKLVERQWVNFTGDTFTVKLKSPEGGLQLPVDTYKNELSLQWNHETDGESILSVNNTGNSDLNVKGTINKLTEPIQITYHILVITAGVVIIGFSAGFSVRKPKGF